MYAKEDIPVYAQQYNVRQIPTVEEVLERKRNASTQSTQPNTPVNGSMEQYYSDSYSDIVPQHIHATAHETAHKVIDIAESKQYQEKQDQNEVNKQAAHAYLDRGAIYHGWFASTVGWWVEGPAIDALHVTAEMESKSGEYTTTPQQYKSVGNLKRACIKFGRRMIAEAIGTAFLTFACATYGVSQSLSNINLTGNAIASGLTLTSLIYSLGDVSGCHINPAVTATFVLRNAFPKRWMVLYWTSQMAGAVVAGASILGFYGDVTGANSINGPLVTSQATGNQAVAPTYALWTVMLFEAIVTSLLCFTLLSVSTKADIVGMHAALAGGFALAAGAMASGGYSSFSMNPARSLGPCLAIWSKCSTIWPYVAGPFIGAAFASLGSLLLKADTIKERVRNAAGVESADNEGP